MKKIMLSLLIMLTLLFPLTSNAFATDRNGGQVDEILIPSDIVIERQDIPRSKAMMDSTFSEIEDVLTTALDKSNSVNAATWNVWGEKGWNPNTYMYYPIGYSEHKNGSTVLSTYHYTRTFLGSTWSPRGDSGRIWGTYTVRARGTDCIQDVWDAFVHRVYYGTSSD